MWTATAQAYISGALTILFGMFIGYFFKGYLTKKGENLATQEDIKKLVDQVSAVTAGGWPGLSHPIEFSPLHDQILLQYVHSGL
jgi:hypothetical protein